jgi:co-chaperonin GroES (HSP10)
MKLLGDKILIKKIEKESGIILPDSVKTQDRIGVVLAVGERCDTVKVGNNVLYSGGISTDDIGEIVSEYGTGCLITNESKIQITWNIPK